ncbi:hypothetical protein PENANT_c020G01715 [Penicillium antarcticum]|uniref:Xylanolytic transcriptional activator regulatory domain-containing protein n=1 Tax=Penicillium antarcticum TaxID=416450 RepID=A0A1V6Q0A6_9EURO|nr:hypothetical protein PENANT_c020G01715 [Penicillium antarcticum]
MEERIRSLQEELNEARASKRRRVQSDSDADPEQGQHSDESESEIPSPRDDTSQVPYEADTNGGDRDEGSYTLKTPKGAMRFFGASSHFSIASPEGAGWLENTKGNNMWRHAVQRNGSRWRLADWYPKALQDDSQSRCSLPLPSKSETLELVHEYFETFNKAVPLFRPESFMIQVNRHFSWNPNEGSSWWAALNVVLAFAYKQRAEGSGGSSDDWQKSLGCVRNAMNVVTEFFMRTCDLLAVQGLLGLALYFQGTPNPQPLFMFAASAVRLSHSIGLHKSNSLGLPEPQVEERKRVFWIAFILDADVCQRTGRPGSQDTRDFSTLLPFEDPPDGLGMMEIRGTKINFFSALARLAVIQRKACDTLYSTEGFKKTREELMKDVRECFEEIEAWKQSIPPIVRPQRNFAGCHHPFLPHILRLHFAYHCCYLNIHRVFLIPRRWSNTPNERPSAPGLPIDRENSIEQSLEAARAAIDLIGHVEGGFGQSFEWGIVYFPAAALVALFSQIIANPSRPDAKTDISRINGVVAFLARVASQEQDTYMDYVLAMCTDWENLARRAIHRAGNPPAERRGASHPPQAQGQRRSQNPNQPQRPFTPGFGLIEHARIDGNIVQSNHLPSDQALYGTGPLSMATPIAWNWQDMLAGAPPSYDFGLFDLAGNNGES